MGALDILLISFGAGVAPTGCTADCNASGTAGAMLLAALVILALLIVRDRLWQALAAARRAFDRFPAVQVPSPIRLRSAA